MGNGNNIIPVKGGNVPHNPHDSRKSGENRSAPQQETAAPKNPKSNAPQLLDKKWQSHKADDLRNNLATRLNGGENKPERAGQHSNRRETTTNQTNKPADEHANRQSNRQTNEPARNPLDKTQTDLPKNPLNKFPAEQPKNLLNRSSAEPHGNVSNKHQDNPTRNLLNQTWDSLIGAAKEHKDLAHFRDNPKQFWNDVRQMSEVRVVETFVNGKPEPRAVSRFGELLKQLSRQGGMLEHFLPTLSPAERKVFQARYQIGQTFGAGELFVGKGIALDKRGEFPVRIFLSHNGKNVELSPHTLFSLLNGGNFDDAHSLLSALGGDLSAADFAVTDNHSTFAGGEVLLNAKNAALLGLSLALYQNAGAALSLADVSAEFLLQFELNGAAPKTLDATKHLTQSSSENVKNAENAARRASESNVGAALINGALATIDKYRKSGFQPDGVYSKSEQRNNNFGFAAGATGAMMGATVGCIVPLAEKSVGEILGFAASVVVGLTDSGLRSLGANTLVSVITTGAQIFLSASNASPVETFNQSTANALNARSASGLFEEDLRQTILNRRTTTLLAS